MAPTGFDLHEHLEITGLQPAKRALTMDSLGFRPGDIFTLEGESVELQFELAVTSGGSK